MRTVALLLVIGVASSVVLAAPTHASTGSTPAQTAAIIDQGFNHSEVMQTSEYLNDRIGGRMTGSPAMRAAKAWTSHCLREWGLSNVHKDGFPFGCGQSTCI